MKSATFASYVALALLLTTPYLPAQSKVQASPKLLVDVPFDFMVGQSMFPAGHYTIKPLTNQNFSLKADRGRAGVKIATKPVRTVSMVGATQLIFHQKNGHYQLHELWLNSTIGALIPESQGQQLANVHESRVQIPAICIGCN